MHHASCFATVKEAEDSVPPLYPTLY